ncbi:hypothetical protein PHYSODRAFT_285757 [Phytophthora sojae]|uniref:Uncharacterized protein n=1 Tax=Phytophthora sojae (strain P6497) TaxID=1094619 RepID=G4Z9K0_PHYSP|nr:hypothetical protein PHYSODRAFT_285757 [Phytophthora sojae]EGZ22632.1 hypothetical protein PHYSODRAFT_285757 [Phytophthora sojae]|eukprot:XP_009525349.1 hypothetical protein PHYSODRAFT_285757 [Phytophthora sojae]
MMDEAVDVGNGLYGPDVVLEQMERYSTYMRFIHLAGKIDTMVKADDSVLVSTKFSVKLQVLRSTIEKVFPHIMTNESVVAQLIGQELLVEGRAMFLFNAAGKCFKLSVDADLVKAFMMLLNDLDAVETLLARALIADNAMIGFVRESSEPDDEEKMAITCQPGVDSVTA